MTLKKLKRFYCLFHYASPVSFHIWSGLNKIMCKKCVCVQENLHWLIASSWGRFISEVLLHRICGGETLRTQCEFIWSLWVTNVNDYFGYLIIFWYPWARNWCACMCGCLHFPGLHLKVSACDSFFPPYHLWFWVCKNSFKDWTWCVGTQWTVGGGLVWFLHSHLKRLNQATQVIFSYKKYICLINTPPGPLQVSWLSLSRPLGLCGLMTTAGQVFRPHSWTSLCYWAKRSMDCLHR